MVLLAGMTGFFSQGEEPPPSVDLLDFRRHCYAAARLAMGRVLTVISPYESGSPRNFAVGTIALGAVQVGVLLNAHQPIVAFAVPSREWEGTRQFRDSPELAKAFDSFGAYQVIPAAELEQAPSASILSGLSAVERKHIAYWKPRRIGDIVFNCWD